MRALKLIAITLVVLIVVALAGCMAFSATTITTFQTSIEINTNQPTWFTYK